MDVRPCPLIFATFNRQLFAGRCMTAREQTTLQTDFAIVISCFDP